MIDLTEHIEKLAGEDEADRIYAAEDIGYANQVEGIPPLFARLPAEPSRAVREAIFDALLQMKDDAVIEGTVTLLDSEDSFLRNHAVEILRARGAAAVPFLERAFREGSDDRRKFVLDVVARLGDSCTTVIYDQALNDRDVNVVIPAVESLGAMSKTAYRERIEKIVAPEVHPMLLCASIDALAQLGNAETPNTVRERLGDGLSMPGYLHASYLKLLGAKGSRDDVGEVARMIERDGLHGHALNALTALRSRFRDLELPVALVEPLRETASKPSPLDACQAVRLMAGFLHIQAVFELLSECLLSPEKGLRIAALQVMREEGSARTEATLRDAVAGETDDEVLQALAR